MITNMGSSPQRISTTHSIGVRRFSALFVVLVVSILTTTSSSSGGAYASASASTGPQAISSASTLVASSSSEEAPPPTGGRNPVVALVTYVKDSVVKTADSCGQLWKNHGKCKAIRQQQSAYRESIGEQWELQGLYASENKKQVRQRLSKLQGGISYADYLFLQKGKEDRSKVMNLAFLMWGAPRFLPYALMFNPDMLPSTFTNDNKNSPYAIESPASRLARERSAAIVQALSNLEHQAKAGSGGNFISKMNIFGKKKQQEKQRQLVNVYDQTRQTLAASLTPRMVLGKLERVLFQSDQDFARAEQRLCHVPPCIVQGMSNVISGKASAGALAALTPNFLQRGKVVNHLRKVAEADDFLIQANIDLDTIPPRVLLETCSDRMMGGPDCTPAELRHSLKEWLQMAVTEPAGKMAAQAAADGTPSLFYNGNVARLALMAHFASQGARGVGRSEPTLPQLLLSGSKTSSDQSTGSVENTKKGGMPKLGWRR